MAFDPGKVYKLQHHLESTAYDWMLERVCTFYGVGEVVELTEEQASEICKYSESDECDSYVCLALRSMLSEWEDEHGVTVTG